jgi:hypothetical protein
MRTYCIILTLLFFTACNSNKLLTIPEEETTTIRTNYITEHYQDFPGTKLSLLPAEHFTHDAGIGGLSSPSKRSWIIASNIQGRSLQAAGLYKARLSDASRPDALEGTLMNEWDLTINAFPSKLFKVQTSLGGDDYLQYVLFIGDTTSAYRVIGNVHEDELEFAPRVKNSMLSIFFDPERQIINGQSPTQTSASPCNCPKH